MLDELVGVIETLKSRINEHRSVLQGNEAQTRLSLIDLCCGRWDGTRQTPRWLGRSTLSAADAQTTH